MPCLGVFFYGNSVAIPNFSVLLQECHKTLRDNQPVNWARWLQRALVVVGKNRRDPGKSTLQIQQFKF